MDQTTAEQPSHRDGAALLGKACDVLLAVGNSPGGITQVELSTQLGLPRTTLYRILANLVGRGLLRQDPTRHGYALGPQLLEMAQRVWAAPDLPAAAAPELRMLRDLTGETAYVAALEGREVLSLAKYEGAHTVRSAARLGQRKPLHCTSQGKAILSFLPDAEREALLHAIKLKRFTSHTLTDPRRLAAELRIVRTRGFATDDEEIAEGVRCVGAPILDLDGRVLGAISIAGPAWRLTIERLELLGAELGAAGRRIGAQVRPCATVATAAQAAKVVPGSPAAFYGISPRWSQSSEGVWWGDALAPEIRRAGPSGDVAGARWEAPLLAMAAARDGCILLVDERGTCAVLGRNGVVRSRREVPKLSALLALRSHRDGSAWASLAEAGGSSIGPLETDGTVRTAWRLPDRVGALAWDVTGTVLFAAVPESGAVHRLEPARPGALLLTRMPPGAGRPSGLAADVEGGLWVTLRDGWSVARLGPDGEIDRVLPLPVPCPTDLCFGGPGLATLYITTARHGVSLDTLGAAPQSGYLLCTIPGVAGLPEQETDWH